MTTTIKNYTQDQEAKMINEYRENPNMGTVTKLSTDMGKSVKSVIAKLVTLKVYVKKVKAKNSTVTITKKDLVKIINEHYNIEMPSLVKATKEDLNTLVTNLSD